jgi:hypothetical protein
VPKKGWTCTGVQDLGSPQATCATWETQTIRYVHTMTHPNYATELKVGCVCAAKMESDYVGPRLRERKLRSTADRKKRWLMRRGWKISARGNPFINTDCFNIVIFSHGDGSWGGRIEERNTRGVVRLKERYITEDAAKLAAFDGNYAPVLENHHLVPIETGIAEAWAKLQAGRATVRTS